MVLVQDRVLDIVETENAELKQELDRLRACYAESQEIIQNMVNKIDELRVIIAECDDAHTETLETLENVSRYVGSALNVINYAPEIVAELPEIHAINGLLQSAQKVAQS